MDEALVSQQAGERLRILIADDHKLMREGTRQFLSQQPDMQVVAEAADGEEAIRLARQLQPDVVLLDIAMPRVNGIQATQAIKEHCPRTAILVLTMYDDEQYIFSLLQAGAAGYLLKDMGSRELIKAVRDVHAGEAVLHPAVAKKVLRRVVRSDNQESQRPGEPLTEREREVLGMAAEGLSNKEIGSRLSLSARTVQAHLSHIFDKLGVGSRTEAVICSLRQGWLRPERLP